MLLTPSPRKQRRALQPAAKQAPEQAVYRRWTGRGATTRNSQRHHGVWVLLSLWAPIIRESEGDSIGPRSPRSPVLMAMKLKDTMETKAVTKTKKPLLIFCFNNRAAPPGSEAPSLLLVAHTLTPSPGRWFRDGVEQRSVGSA